PSPRRTKKGSSSPTARIARTGELTPPGMRSSARRNKALRGRRTRVPISLLIVPSEAKGLPPPPENAKHFSGTLEPARQLLRPVRDHEIGAGALDRSQRLECRGTFVEESLRCGSLHHRVLARDVVGGERQVEALACCAKHVEVRQGGLDHEYVCTFGDVLLALAERFAHVRGIHLVATAVAEGRRGL